MMKREFCTSCKSTITVDGLGNRVVCENERLEAINADLLDVLLEVIEDGLKTNMDSWKQKANATIKKATGELWLSHQERKP